MDEYIIKVTPEQLEMVSTEVLEKVRGTEMAFENMSSIIENSCLHWESDANTKMREIYEIRKDDYARIFREIRQHILNLQTIAGVYKEVEKVNADFSADLPADLII